MGYGATFGSTTGSKIDCGSGAGIDNLSALTFLIWAKPTTLTTSREFGGKYRGVTNEGWHVTIDASVTSRLFAEMMRVTTPAASKSNSGVIVADTPICIAAVIDRAASPVIKLYVGSLTAAMAEVSYAMQTDGSGSFVDESARSFFYGNRDITTPNQALQGDEYCGALYSGALSLADCEKWRLRPVNITLGSTIAFNHILCAEGNTGTQVDRTGNGNDGTLTDVTAATTSLPLALHGRIVAGGANSRSLAGRGLAA